MAQVDEVKQGKTVSSYREAFGIRPREVIALVGGGGKTTLMYALARELASPGAGVITTTTTKILEPLPGESPLLLLEEDEAKQLDLVRQQIGKYRHITLARKKLLSGKLIGISLELIQELASTGRITYIIVEADGSARKPLKAPNATEPVIPPNTSLLIPVVGLDALGSRLTEESVFRAHIASELLRVPLGETITAESIARLLTHERGIIKGSPPDARIVPFINKTDLPPGLAGARDIAVKILATHHPQIKRVVLGQAQSPRPVVEIILF